MDDEDHAEEDEPANEGTEATADVGLVKKQTNRDSANHLREPVHEVVQRPSTDVEDGAVEVVELCAVVSGYSQSEIASMLTPCVEPVTGEEHGEQKEDPRVATESGPEAQELGLPRWVLGNGDLGAV